MNVHDVDYSFLQSIKQYRKSFHDHDPSVHLDGDWEPTIPVGTSKYTYTSRQYTEPVV